MESTWVDSYYDALEFFYWEPQHFRIQTPATEEAEKLKTIANTASKLDQIRRHLRRMELTLNHNLLQFFQLAPNELRTSLFGKLFGRQFTLPFEMHTREVDKEFKLASCTQPDFLFTSQEEVVCIEMKVAAKCKVDQVLKYALLGLGAEMRENGYHKKHHLVILGMGSFATQFREKFGSLEELKNNISNRDLNMFLQNKPAHLREQPQRFADIVKGMHLQFLNYERLADLLWENCPGPSDTSPGAEVYRNLISGVVGEFKRRNLS